MTGTTATDGTAATGGTTATGGTASGGNGGNGASGGVSSSAGGAGGTGASAGTGGSAGAEAGCPAGDPDSDGDDVCDSADICGEGDDVADEDVDGVPDACDVCPGKDDAAVSCVYYLYEDFEDGDYAGWELLEEATQPVAVVDELGADGTNHSIALKGSTHYLEGVSYSFPEPIQPTYVSFSVWPVDHNGTALYFALTEDVSDTQSQEAAYIYFDGSSEQVYAINQYWADFVPDQWQEVEMWFDWKLHTHDLYINGEIIVEGAPFHSEHVGEVVIYNRGGGLFGYFDEIRVR